MFSFIFLAGCQTVPVQEEIVPNVQEYVSATSTDQQYVSALLEAQSEFTEDDQVVIISQAEPQGVPLPDLPALGDLWSQPPASHGKGFSLKNAGMRKRLNDALETTPLGGRAEWAEGMLTYLFVPNSPIYKPHHSGGRCRDGVIAIYGDDFNDQEIRGLFCQTGPGADWLLLRE